MAATVDQGGNVVNACPALGIPTLKCRAHCINSSVMWALGIAGADSKCKNNAMKHLVGRAAALVGVFSHSAVNNDVLRDIQQTLSDRRRKALQSLRLEAEHMENEVSSLQQPGPACDDDTHAGSGQASNALSAGPATDSCNQSELNEKRLVVLNTVRQNDTRYVPNLINIRLLLREVFSAVPYSRGRWPPSEFAVYFC